MMKTKPFRSARRFLALACLGTALIAGSVLTASAQAAINFRV